MDSYSKKFFSFNLIPPKSKEEIETLVERDRSMFYSFLLIFFSIFIYFILTLLNTFILSPRIESLESNIEKQKSQVITYNSTRSLNGEVFSKSQALAPVLALDIGSVELLETSEEFILDVSSAQIVSYGREFSGEFILSIIVDDYDSVALLIENAKKQENIDNVFLRQASVSIDKTYVTAVIAFTITNQDLNG